MSIVRCCTRDASLIVGSSQVYRRSERTEEVCSGGGFGQGCYINFGQRASGSVHDSVPPGRRGHNAAVSRLGSEWTRQTAGLSSPKVAHPLRCPEAAT